MLGIKKVQMIQETNAQYKIYLFTNKCIIYVGVDYIQSIKRGWSLVRSWNSPKTMTIDKLSMTIGILDKDDAQLLGANIGINFSVVNFTLYLKFDTGSNNFHSLISLSYFSST